MFPSNLMNIAQERDFYRLRDMNDADLALVQEMLIGPMNRPEMRELASYLLAVFDQARQIKQAYEELGIDASEELEALYLEAEEQFHGTIEQGAVPLLDRLLHAKSFVIEDELEYQRFVHFVMTQYFRTRRMRENLRRGLGASFARIETSMGAIRHIMAMASSLTLVGTRDSMRPQLLINRSEIPLITGDQPAINTHAVYQDDNQAVAEMELYYPISPSRAVLFSESNQFESREFGAEAAREFNRMMALSAEHQIFGAKMSDLEEWKAIVGASRPKVS